jgi:hypothetical protein
VERRDARQVRHRIELIGADGRLWCRLAPAEYWRFYWPEEYVDYFRFKEDYLLAHPWPRGEEAPAGVPPYHISRSADGGPGGPLRLVIPDDLRQPVLRASVARVSLGPEEWKEFCSLRLPEDLITAWLYPRIAAKDAARALWWQRDGVRLFPADLTAELEEDGCGTVRRRATDEVVGVTIAPVAGGVEARVAFAHHRVPSVVQPVSRERLSV